MVLHKSGRRPRASLFLFLMLAIMATLLTACGSLPFAAPTATPLPPTSTPIPPTATAIPPTAPPQPTATSVPTATPIPALAVVPEGVDSWCLPIDFGAHVEGPNGPDSQPVGARPGIIEKDTGLLNLHIPAITCTVVYTFNQPMPAGIALSIYDYNQGSFIQTPLLPSSTNPNKGYAVLNHPYIINPPFWWLNYIFILTNAEGAEVHRIEVQVFKSLPEKCWDGSLPDPVTLFCPIQDS